MRRLARKLVEQTASDVGGFPTTGAQAIRDGRPCRFLAKVKNSESLEIGGQAQLLQHRDEGTVIIAMKRHVSFSKRKALRSSLGVPSTPVIENLRMGMRLSRVQCQQSMTTREPCGLFGTTGRG